MEFNVDDGVRLVRSITDKVLSVMAKVKIETPTDRCTSTNTIVTDDHDIQNSGNPNKQVCHVSRKKYKPPDYEQNRNEVTLHVNELVKHRDKLSAINMLPTVNVNDVCTQVHGCSGERTDSSTVSVCTTDTIYDEDWKAGGLKLDCDINDSKNMGDTLKSMGGNFLSNMRNSPLSKCISEKINAENNFPSHRRLKFRLDRQTNDTDKTINEFNCNNNTSNMKAITKNENNSTSESNNCDIDLSLFENPEHIENNFISEFANDVQYLTGCHNKTSTPVKDATKLLSTINDRKDFLSTIEDRKTIRQSAMEIKMTDPVNCSTSDDCQDKESEFKNVSPQRLFPSSPLKRHRHTISPLARKHVGYTRPGFSTNNAFSGSDSLWDIDIDLASQRTNPIEPSPDTKPTSVKPLSNRSILPKTSTSVSGSLFGVRRSLFSDSSTLNRLLPLELLQSGKPLGYDAFQQFLSVSKTDVLPKYFFENEDEEAAYYLKVKYLDDDEAKR